MDCNQYSQDLWLLYNLIHALYFLFVMIELLYFLSAMIEVNIENLEHQTLINFVFANFPFLLSLLM